MADQLTGEALARELGRLLASNQNLKLSQNGILAMLGNAGKESKNFTTGVQESNNASGIGPGRGLFQWDSRAPEFKAYLKANPNAFKADDWMNPLANAGFAAQELLGSEGRKKVDVPGFGRMTVLEALQNNNIPYDELTRVVHRKFERPADTLGKSPSYASEPGRLAWADKAKGLYENGGWGDYASQNYY